jgi:integrase/recombinase XerD
LATKPLIKFEPRRQDGREIIGIIFKYHPGIIRILNKIEGSVWSPDLRIWYIPADKFKLSDVYEKLSSIAYIDYSDIGNHKTGRRIPNDRNRLVSSRESKLPKSKEKKPDLPDGYLEKLERKRYSEKTVSTYTSYFRDFVSHFHGRELETITPDEINAYIL